MRLSSQRASSMWSIGTLDAARVTPSFRRRVASARPRRCGIETIRGAGIFVSLDYLSACSRQSSPKKNPKRNLSSCHLFLDSRQNNKQMPTVRLEEIATCLLEQSFLLFLLSRYSAALAV